MRKAILSLLLAGGAGLLPGAPAAAVVLSRSVVANGGAASSGTVRSIVTLGQPAIGVSNVGAMTAWHGFWRGNLLNTSAVPTDPIGPAGAPVTFAFGMPAPNPTRGRTDFDLALPGAATVRLTLVDVAGRVAAVAQDGRLESGRHRIHWDGRGALGGILPGGVYYARLEVDGRVAGQRAIVVIR